MKKYFKKEHGVFCALAEVLKQVSADEPIHLDKVAFARYVLLETAQLREEQRRGSSVAAELLPIFDKNFQTLFSKLNGMRRDAEREARGERVSFRVDRAKRSFVLDHPVTATKEQAVVLLEEIDAVLDGSQESDEIRTEIQAIRRDFQLDVGLKEQITELGQFKLRLDRLKYAGRIATQEKKLVPSLAKPALEGVVEKVSPEPPKVVPDSKLL